MTPEQFQELRALFESGDVESGVKKVNFFLETQPDDPSGVFIAGLFLMKMGWKGVAFSLFDRANQIRPDQPETLNNMGVCLYNACSFERAKGYYEQAIELNPKDADFLANMVAVEVGLGNFHSAIEWGKRGLKIDPDSLDILYNSGLAYLATGQYVEGWKRYDVSLGNRFRQERYYDNEMSLPKWDGEKVDGEVVVYGEQGLGDEILFYSMIPDAAKDAKIIIECDSRLQGLVQRSFPELKVYGTRWEDQIMWPSQHDLAAKCEAGHLGKLYRPDRKKIPRTPYLVADPERRSAYRKILDDIGPGKKVGIAWTGGREAGEQERRNITLDMLKPLLKEDIHVVDLEYRDRTTDIANFVNETGIPINQFRWITHPGDILADYDDTAALVAELDLVICVATTVGELAGAMGVPCIQLAPEVPTWRIGTEGTEHPWYASETVLRQKNGDWEPTIEEARKCMLSLFANQAAASARATSQD